MMEIYQFINRIYGTFAVLTDPENSDIWFLGNELAEVLGYSNYSSAILRHTDKSDRKTLNFRDYHETRLSKLWAPGDFRPKTLINESGMYCMVFGAELPYAKEFKKWVTTEVLPSIRRNGGYIAGQEFLTVEEQKELQLQVKELSSRVCFLRKRRKELIRKNEHLREFRKRLRKENQYLKQDGDELFEMYWSLMHDYLETDRQLEKLHGGLEREKVTSQESLPKRRIVDSQGFIIG